MASPTRACARRAPENEQRSCHDALLRELVLESRRRDEEAQRRHEEAQRRHEEALQEAQRRHEEALIESRRHREEAQRRHEQFMRELVLANSARGVDLSRPPQEHARWASPKKRQREVRDIDSASARSEPMLNDEPVSAPALACIAAWC
jgi:hypothetical protein